jgi:hypothetical protein
LLQGQRIPKAELENLLQAEQAPQAALKRHVISDL